VRRRHRAVDLHQRQQGFGFPDGEGHVGGRYGPRLKASPWAVAWCCGFPSAITVASGEPARNPASTSGPDSPPIPGIGPVVAAGWLITTLASAARDEIDAFLRLHLGENGVRRLEGEVARPLQLGVDRTRWFLPSHAAHVRHDGLTHRFETSCSAVVPITFCVR
jgi:hypothetical protein